MAHVLCENCLADGASAVPVGHEIGNQRDSYRDSLFLCEPCSEALLKHDFFTFAGRFTTERTIRNLRKT